MQELDTHIMGAEVQVLKSAAYDITIWWLVMVCLNSDVGDPLSNDYEGWAYPASSCVCGMRYKISRRLEYPVWWDDQKWTSCAPTSV